MDSRSMALFACLVMAGALCIDSARVASADLGVNAVIEKDEGALSSDVSGAPLEVDARELLWGRSRYGSGDDDDDDDHKPDRDDDDDNDYRRPRPRPKYSNSDDDKDDDDYVPRRPKRYSPKRPSYGRRGLLYKRPSYGGGDDDDDDHKPERDDDDDRKPHRDDDDDYRRPRPRPKYSNSDDGKDDDDYVPHRPKRPPPKKRCRWCFGK